MVFNEEQANSIQTKHMHIRRHAMRSLFRNAVESSVLPPVQELLHRRVRRLTSGSDLFTSVLYRAGEGVAGLTVASRLEVLKVRAAVCVVTAFGVPAIVLYTV